MDCDSLAVPVRFSQGSARPRAVLPPQACDCHVHVYDGRYPAAPGARLLPPDASAGDYRALQRRLGTSRCVLVTPPTYGSDNRCMLDGLAAAKAQPSRLTFVSGGSGTVLPGRAGGAGAVHVRTRGRRAAPCAGRQAARAGRDLGGTPRQLGELQKSDSAKWAQLIREAGIKAD